MNALPVWAVAVITIVCVVFSVSLQLLARWRFGIDRLVVNHEVAGFKYAVVSVAYAVLLAFVVFGVWSELDRTNRSRRRRSGTILPSFSRSSYNFPEGAWKQDAPGPDRLYVAVRNRLGR
ncbi:MAG: hypothetical protein R3D62_11675 [Xanthobacteraceae bacterium]